MIHETLGGGNEQLNDFLEGVVSQLEMTEGTSIGWFGFINPGDMSLATIEEQIRLKASDAGRQVASFEYPQEHKDKRPWFQLVEQTAGVNAPLIILKPSIAIYDNEQQKADHFFMGMQSYGLPVRNTSSEHGHGIITLAPEELSAETYTKTFRTCIDLASYSSLSANLALDQ